MDSINYCDELVSRYESTVQELEEKKQELKTLRKNASDVEHRISDNNKVIEEQSNYIQELKDKMNEATKYMDGLRIKNGELSKEAEILNFDIDSLGEDIKTVEARKNELKKEVSRVNKAVEMIASLTLENIAEIYKEHLEAVING